MPHNLVEIFNSLRPFYSIHAEKCVVIEDDASTYYLGSKEVRAKDGYRTGFGGVSIKTSYVSAYLMPIYTHPEMLDGLSPELRKRMQGKSCFNFKAPNDVLFGELQTLIAKGVARFEKDGRL